MHLLVVEDDAAVGPAMVAGLERSGFTTTLVTRSSDVDAALDAADLVLLDLGLPDDDGLEVCRRIRGRSAIPVIVVTARGEEVDRVVGLELGADDYVVKPFGLRELVARIRAVARRAQPAPPEHPQQLGQLVIDRRARRITLLDVELALTPKEFDLLALLAEDPGAACSRRDILESVWDAHWYGPTKTVDVHVAALRRKLGDPRWIETIRSVGYRLAVPE